VSDMKDPVHTAHATDTVRAAEATGDPSNKGFEADDGARAEQGDRGRGYLSKTAEALRSTGLTVRTEAAHGPPAEEILRFAASARAGLIVMSTCGRSDPWCPLGGSVVQKVTQDAKLPVLLVQAQMACRQEQRKPREQRSAELAVVSGTKGVVAQQVPARL
jgi:nucleotide-binding universal stress UspA family protein